MASSQSIGGKREREEEKDYQERNFEKNKLLFWHLMNRSHGYSTNAGEGV